MLFKHMLKIFLLSILLPFATVFYTVIFLDLTHWFCNFEDRTLCVKFEPCLLSSGILSFIFLNTAPKYVLGDLFFS